ncbi:MAG TPA: proteasome-type protease [Burkholderiales bacterium]|nr:proteasome-type protease [Burkholderiales bacterium]
MTYCAATLLDAGIVFASDSRTNAGIDNISTYKKMKVYEVSGERVLVILCSGNLAVTQATLNHLDQSIRQNNGRTLLNVSSMFHILELLGDALREVRQRDAPFLLQSNIESGACFIVGGQIHGEEQRLFMLYSEGNFIEVTPETPFFQIGETKYGKPILDRVIKSDTTMDEATKCVLVSFDSTMRSNISVGMPIDLLCYERDTLRVTKTRRFDERDDYMRGLRQQWSDGLRKVFTNLPSFEWQ